MNSLILEIPTTVVQNVVVTENEIIVDLNDGRTISVPITWFPRLKNGSVNEKKNWRLIAGGEGIHWIDLDEDISVENLIQGKPSAESQNSLKRWLEHHSFQGKKITKKSFSHQH